MALHKKNFPGPKNFSTKKYPSKSHNPSHEQLTNRVARGPILESNFGPRAQQGFRTGTLSAPTTGSGLAERLRGGRRHGGRSSPSRAGIGMPIGNVPPSRRGRIRTVGTLPGDQPGFALRRGGTFGSGVSASFGSRRRRPLRRRRR